MTSPSDVAAGLSVQDRATKMADRLLVDFRSTIVGFLKNRQTPEQIKHVVLDHLKKELKLAFPQAYHQNQLNTVIATTKTNVSARVDEIVTQRNESK
jgi:hypothetical protein